MTKQAALIPLSRKGPLWREIKPDKSVDSVMTEPRRHLPARSLR
jgi:hypothetical protein